MIDNKWILIGLILQFTAGWVFIVDQLISKYYEIIHTWRKNRKSRTIAVSQIGGKPPYWKLLLSTWRRSLLLALITFTVGLYLSLVYSDEFTISYGAIIGPIVYLLLSYSIYLLSLTYLLKRMGKWNLTTDKFAGTTADMNKANFILLGTSTALFVLLFFIQNLVATSGEILRLAIGIPILFAVLFIVPVYFMSLVYLIPDMVFIMFTGLRKIPRIAYWIIVLITWTVGGIVLISNAAGYLS